MKKVDWAKIINGLDVEFPDEGEDASDIEMYPLIVQPNEMIGNLTRLTLDIFIFDNDDLEQAYMMQNEKMRIYQNISLKDSMDIVARGKRKKT